MLILRTYGFSGAVGGNGVMEPCLDIGVPFYHIGGHSGSDIVGVDLFKEVRHLQVIGARKNIPASDRGISPPIGMGLQ